MQVERFSHVQHLVSHVEAELRQGCDALDALRAVFPAGTLSGAPKVRAMQLIAELESERRGVYGGAVGYLGYDGSLDTAIAIRSAVLSDGQIHVHSGAGIVARQRAGARVRGDRAEGGGHVARDPVDRRRRPAEAAAIDRQMRHPVSRSLPGGRSDPRHRQLRLVHVQPRPGARGRQRHGPRRAQRRASTVSDLIALADDPAAPLRGIVISPGPGGPEDAGISTDAIRSGRRA